MLKLCYQYVLLCVCVFQKEKKTGRKRKEIFFKQRYSFEIMTFRSKKIESVLWVENVILFYLNNSSFFYEILFPDIVKYIFSYRNRIRGEWYFRNQSLADTNYRSVVSECSFDIRNKNCVDYVNWGTPVDLWHCLSTISW